MKTIVEYLVDYPVGAIKEVIEVLDEGMKEGRDKDLIVYCVDGYNYNVNKDEMSEPLLEKLYLRYPFLTHHEDNDQFYIPPKTIAVNRFNVGLLRNSFSNCFLFFNYWLAHAYFLRLKEMWEKSKREWVR